MTSFSDLKDLLDRAVLIVTEAVKMVVAHPFEAVAVAVAGWVAITIISWPIRWALRFVFPAPVKPLGKDGTGSTVLERMNDNLALIERKVELFEQKIDNIGAEVAKSLNGPALDELQSFVKGIASPSNALEVHLERIEQLCAAKPVVTTQLVDLAPLIAQSSNFQATLEARLTMIASQLTAACQLFQVASLGKNGGSSVTGNGAPKLNGLNSAVPWGAVLDVVANTQLTASERIVAVGNLRPYKTFSDLHDSITQIAAIEKDDRVKRLLEQFLKSKVA